MEKGKHYTGSPFGSSQAIRWKEVDDKFIKGFRTVKTTSVVASSISPRHILIEMGKDYCLKRDNCQHAAKRGWKLWHSQDIKFLTTMKTLIALKKMKNAARTHNGVRPTRMICKCFKMQQLYFETVNS